MAAGWIDPKGKIIDVGYDEEHDDYLPAGLAMKEAIKTGWVRWSDSDSEVAIELHDDPSTIRRVIKFVREASYGDVSFEVDIVDDNRKPIHYFSADENKTIQQLNQRMHQLEYANESHTMSFRQFINL